MASIPLIEFGPMVRAARLRKGWSQEALAAEALGNMARKGYISQVENGKLPGISAMTAQQLATALDLDPSVVPRLLGVLPPDTAEIDSEISHLRNAVGGLEAALSDARHLSRDTLIALATRFGRAEAHIVPDGTLRAFLADKAQEYHAYRKTIDALDDRVAAIANLKGAAQDAAERLDFDEVENLLARVNIVELEIAATTTEARASNALMRNRPEQAHSLLSACADSFASVSPIDTARRRQFYSELLYDHGAKFGGAGVSCAIHLLDRLLDDLPLEVDQWRRYVGLNLLGIALQAEGNHTIGEEGTGLLFRAVDVCEAALQLARAC